MAKQDAFAVVKAFFHYKVVVLGKRGALLQKFPPAWCQLHCGHSTILSSDLPFDQARRFHLPQCARCRGAVDPNKIGYRGRLDQCFVADGQKNAPGNSGQAQLLQSFVKAAFLKSGSN